jgi:prostatic aicd phosphatase
MYYFISHGLHHHDWSLTSIKQQEFQLGQKLRGLYLNEISPSFISGINTTLVDNTQFRVRADGGGEGVVILNSAQSLVQGLFPATKAYNVTLANGKTITGPLGGYQASSTYFRSTSAFSNRPFTYSTLPVSTLRNFFHRSDPHPTLVESVEPANDISLEGWTSCNVILYVLFSD